jgi:8-oxo-dGTP diphosphatase
MSARPDFGLVGASAHDAAEIAKAAALGCDFAVLGPVLPTPSHTGEPSLGWNHFATLARDAELPVYALGGLRPSDANQAAAHGAHGIAMMRGAWPK